MAVFKRIVDGAADVVAALDGQKILMHAAAVGCKQALGRRIDAEDHALFVHQDQALGHIGCNLVEFVRPALKRAQLVGNLAALLMDAREQRRQLLIGVVFQRLVQIQPVERRDNPAGNALCQHSRQNQRRQQHHQHREPEPLPVSMA